MTDFRVEQARDHHIQAGVAAERADLHRQRRDKFVRELRKEDPKMWSYAQLAKAVDCSKTLIRHILENRSDS